MATAEHVVLRTPWSLVLLNVVPICVLPLVSLTLDPWLWGFVMLSILFVAAALMHRVLLRVILTPEGLVIRWLRSRLVPWNHIGAVRRSSMLGSEEVTIWDVTENRTRRLPAPRSFSRLGSGDIAAAHALVERWWIAHRGPAPAVAARPILGEPGLAGNPYAPPPGG